MAKSEANSIEYLDQTVVNRLRSILVGRNSKAQSVYQGLHPARRQGQSMEYRDHREYVPGDDPRHIDWRLFARTERYYVRQFEEDTNLNTLLIMDESASMGKISSRGIPKVEFAKQVMVTLAYLLLGQGDRVGVCRFTNRLETLLPPTSSPDSIVDLLRKLKQPPKEIATDPRVLLDGLGLYRHQRILIVVLTDLISNNDTFIDLFRHLAGANVEGVIWHVLDPLEVDLDLKGEWTFIDPESNKKMQLNVRAIRKIYLERFAQFRKRQQEELRNTALGYFPANTETPYTQLLAHFLEAYYGGRS